jgi:hypothetical protein
MARGIEQQGLITSLLEVMVCRQGGFQAEFLHHDER